MPFARPLTRAAIAAALAVTISPLAVGGAGMPGERLIAAFAKAKPKSANHANGQATQGKAAAPGNSGNAAHGNPHPAAVPEGAETASVPGKLKNIHAQLAGLNSLNRNINGLMNSSDPRMDGVRDYMGAYMQIPDAEAALAAATADLASAQQAFDTRVAGYGLTSYDGSYVYDGASLDDLSNHLSELNAQSLTDPTNTDLIAERDALASALDDLNASQELMDLTGAQLTYDTAATDLTTLQDATTDDVLTAALIDAANKNRIAQYGDDYITPDILEWARNALGIDPASTTTTDPLVQ